MKYAVKLDNSKYIVEIEGSVATILEKVDNQSTKNNNDMQTDCYDIPDFDFSADKETELVAIHSQLPGTVIKVFVKNGDYVKKGDVLLVVESMKMENEIIADCDCTVTQVIAGVGDYIKKDQPLITIVTAD